MVGEAEGKQDPVDEDAEEWSRRAARGTEGDGVGSDESSSLEIIERRREDKAVDGGKVCRAVGNGMPGPAGGPDVGNPGGPRGAQGVISVGCGSPIESPWPPHLLISTFHFLAPRHPRPLPRRPRSCSSSIPAMTSYYPHHHYPQPLRQPATPPQASAIPVRNPNPFDPNIYIPSPGGSSFPETTPGKSRAWTTPMISPN